MQVPEVPRPIRPKLQDDLCIGNENRADVVAEGIPQKTLQPFLGRDQTIQTSHLVVPGRALLDAHTRVALSALRLLGGTIRMPQEIDWEDTIQECLGDEIGNESLHERDVFVSDSTILPPRPHVNSQTDTSFITK